MDKDLVRIYDVLTDIKTEQIQQAAVLAEHIRRTELAETRLDKLQEELTPLKQHVALWGALGKIISTAGVLVGIATAVFKLVIR